MGKYFPYQESFSATPYLSKIEVLTASEINSAKFNIRLYTMNQSGIPDLPIFNENIICTAKRGSNLTTIDLTDKFIEMPSTGVLVAVEFLIVEENKYVYRFSKDSKMSKLESIGYAPLIGTVPVESGENSWQYSRGKWNTTSRATYLKLPEYKDKFTEPAIKLTLTN
ncbi:MAG: hypothetical protein EBR30_11585 [Cytophagia bacterium]|nr:hypothetical protein [Cytophagia bacterium]